MSFFDYPVNFIRDARKVLDFSSIENLRKSAYLLPLMRSVRKHAKVRIPRLKALHRLAQDLDVLGIDGDIAEFGVWRGGSAAVLAIATQKSPNPRHIWMFDSFQGNPKPTREDGNRMFVQYHDGWNKASSQVVRDLFHGLNIPERRFSVVEGWFEDTFPSVTISKLALIHFDAETYASAKLTLEKYYDALQPGGYLVYNSWKVRDGIRLATEEFIKARKCHLKQFPIDGGIAMGFQKLSM